MSRADSCVYVHVRILRACGFCRAPRDASRPRLHDAYRALTLTVTTTYLMQECIYAYKESGDMEKVARVMFLLLCHVTSLVKQVVFWADAARIDRLLRAVEERAAPAALGEPARAAAARFVRLYAGTAVLTCTLWAAFPVLDRARRRPVDFPFWLGFNYDHPLKFTLVLLYSYYVTTLVGIANTTMDAFIATVLNHCKTQLTVLRMNFLDLPERALAAGGGSAGFERALRPLFLDCLAHYHHIHENMKLLQDIFSFAILVQFGVGGWILCMAAYKIVSLNVLSGEFASMMLFMCCILTELFLYCYYGNEVTVESAQVAGAVYGMRWRRAPARFQRALLVVMERARRPLLPAAGRVVPLSLDTFLKILKSSYTFYTVLRQTK